MDKNINEAPSSVNTSLYQNTDFKDRVVGSSTPSKDKINPSLLAYIDKAAKAAGVKVSVTTAVTGHKNSGRHPKGNAVDIAMVNGKGFSSLSAAKSNGIYDAINKFVSELISMGYTKNSESGNDKAVLTFGFPGHDNHVHVSRNSDGGVSNSNSTLSSKENSDDETKSSEGNNTNSEENPEGDTEQKPKNKIFTALLNMVGIDESTNQAKNINENISRIKKLMK